jgi:Protein of unknown function (DUF3761)
MINREDIEMRNFFRIVAVAACLAPFISYSAAPANAPAGTTGMCKDGTYYSGATKQGACQGHKGVKEWYGAPAAAAGQSTPTATPAPTSPKPTATPATAKGATTAGGPGQVWVNMSTKVYHCPGNKWYGKTKQGEFMSEADAKAKGFKPDHGKACS